MTKVKGRKDYQNVILLHFMTPALEGTLRALLTVVVFAILGFVANATNLVDVLGPTWSAIVAALAASALAGLDHHLSPAGTVAFGTVGKLR